MHQESRAGTNEKDNFRCSYCYRVRYKPCDINHWTAAFSANWSCSMPPSLQLCLWAATADMEHCLTFATMTLFMAGCTVTLVGQVKGKVYHRRWLLVILPLTGDVYGIFLSIGVIADSCRKKKTYICVTANLHVGLSSQSACPLQLCD